MYIIEICQNCQWLYCQLMVVLRFINIPLFIYLCWLNQTKENNNFSYQIFLLITSLFSTGSGNCLSITSLSFIVPKLTNSIYWNELLPTTGSTAIYSHNANYWKSRTTDLPLNWLKWDVMVVRVVIVTWDSVKVTGQTWLILKAFSSKYQAWPITIQIVQ